jgi:dUTP pyrophosphatase
MKIKLLSPNAKMPTKGSEQAAGYDLYAPKDTIINPGRNIIPIDIAIALSIGYEAQIRPRSGFSAKGFEGYVITENGHEETPTRFDCDVLLGTVDSDYRGNVGVIVNSHETKPFLVTAGTRIAQMVIANHWSGDLAIVDELNDTERGTGGYNSTGTR